MASFERGTKRQCLHCGTKFYDLNRDPILCPNCGKVFQLADKPLPRYAKEVVVTKDPEDADEAVDTPGPEIVSLDEVEAEEENADDDIPDVDDVDDVEDIGKDDADVFLEDDDDDDDDSNLGFDVGNRDGR